jgi:hypothetical protein
LIKLKRILVFFAIGFLAVLLLASTDGYSAVTECPTSFAHYLHFFQIRYDGTIDHGTPLPENLVKFTLGEDPATGAEQCYYVDLKTIEGHEEFYRSASGFLEEAVALNIEEIKTLLEREGTKMEVDSYKMTLDKLQRADVNKLHQELIKSNPELFPNGKELNYGVQFKDEYGNVKLNDENKAFPDSDPGWYQQGKTMVQPTLYTGRLPTRFHWNYNSPAVRKYLIGRALKALSKSKDNCLFIDNAGIHEGQFYNNGILHYISAGNEEEQIMLHTANTIDILNKIKEAKNPKLILNDLRDHDPWNEMRFNKIIEEVDIDGLLIENLFWLDTGCAFGNSNCCTNIQFYLDWIQKLKGKKILFTANNSDQIYPAENFTAENSQFIEKVWLWLHLVANDNVYVFINNRYMTSMVPYAVYNFPIGNPISVPYKEGNIWYRKYQRGTIVFDTTSGKLDAIKFIEENTCPVEICDSKDNDGDTLIDEDNVCCGNSECETELGETIETCPQDCPECVDNEKLLGYISQWKRGEITMLTLMQKLKQYKAGTGC